jgi:hypothetical protein
MCTASHSTHEDRRPQYPLSRQKEWEVYICPADGHPLNQKQRFIYFQIILEIDFISVIEVKKLLGIVLISFILLATSATAQFDGPDDFGFDDRGDPFGGPDFGPPDRGGDPFDDRGFGFPDRPGDFGDRGFGSGGPDFGDSFDRDFFEAGERGHGYSDRFDEGRVAEALARRIVTQKVAQLATPDTCQNPDDIVDRVIEDVKRDGQIQDQVCSQFDRFLEEIGRAAEFCDPAQHIPPEFAEILSSGGDIRTALKTRCEAEFGRHDDFDYVEQEKEYCIEDFKIDYIQCREERAEWENQSYDDYGGYDDYGDYDDYGGGYNDTTCEQSYVDSCEAAGKYITVDDTGTCRCEGNGGQRPGPSDGDPDDGPGPGEGETYNCTEEYAPVCAGGVSYHNRCKAEFEGHTDIRDGPCEDPNAFNCSTAGCPDLCSPSIGCYDSCANITCPDGQTCHQESTGSHCRPTEATAAPGSFFDIFTGLFTAGLQTRVVGPGQDNTLGNTRPDGLGRGPPRDIGPRGPGPRDFGPQPQHRPGPRGPGGPDGGFDYCDPSIDIDTAAARFCNERYEEAKARQERQMDRACGRQIEQIAERLEQEVAGRKEQCLNEVARAKDRLLEAKQQCLNKADTDEARFFVRDEVDLTCAEIEVAARLDALRGQREQLRAELEQVRAIAEELNEVQAELADLAADVGEQNEVLGQLVAQSSRQLDESTRLQLQVQERQRGLFDGLIGNADAQENARQAFRELLRAEGDLIAAGDDVPEEHRARYQQQLDALQDRRAEIRSNLESSLRNDAGLFGTIFGFNPNAELEAIEQELAAQNTP